MICTFTIGPIEVCGSKREHRPGRLASPCCGPCYFGWNWLLHGCSLRNSIDVFFFGTCITINTEHATRITPKTKNAISCTHQPQSALYASKHHGGPARPVRIIIYPKGWTLWRPLLPYECSYKASITCQTGLILTSGNSALSVRVPVCQKLQMTALTGLALLVSTKLL